MEKPRKEIFVLSGLTILGIAMIVLNGTIAGLLYRHHHSKVFQENFDNRIVYADLLRESRDLKNMIVEKEKVPNWESTEFGKELAFRYRGKRTYTNEGAGIAFDYPADYVESITQEKEKGLTLVSQRDAKARESVNVPSEGPVTITLQLLPRMGMKAEEWIKKVPESNFQLGSGEYTVTPLSGYRAVIYQWSGLYEAISYAVETKEHIALFTVTYIGRSDDIVRDFDLVLSTLRKI